MSTGFLENFGLRYESTIEEDCAVLLCSRSLVHLVTEIPPCLFREIGSLPPALELVLQLGLSVHRSELDGQKRNHLTNVILNPFMETSCITSLRVLPADKRLRISGFRVSQSTANGRCDMTMNLFVCN